MSPWGLASRRILSGLTGGSCCDSGQDMSTCTKVDCLYLAPPRWSQPASGKLHRDLILSSGLSARGISSVHPHLHAFYPKELNELGVAIAQHIQRAVCVYFPICVDVHIDSGEKFIDFADANLDVTI